MEVLENNGCEVTNDWLGVDENTAESGIVYNGVMKTNKKEQ